MIFSGKLACWLLAAIVVLLVGAGAARADLPYIEVTPAVRPPQGVVILIHGGGFQEVGPQFVRMLDPQVAQFTAAGWATVNTDYSAELGSLPDALAVYDYVRGALGPSVRICLYGQSAGATLALLVAQRRADVGCVIDAAGGIDLPALDSTLAAPFVDALAQAGASLAEWSPALDGLSLRMPVLAECAVNDPFVPCAQAWELRSVSSAVQVVALSAGGAPWVHSDVDGRRLLVLQRAEDAFLGGRVPRARPWHRRHCRGRR